MKAIIGMCLLLFITGALAVTIVVALIPIYLRPKDVSIYQSNAGIGAFSTLNMKSSSP